MLKTMMMMTIMIVKLRYSSKELSFFLPPSSLSSNKDGSTTQRIIYMLLCQLQIPIGGFPIYDKSEVNYKDEVVELST